MNCVFYILLLMVVFTSISAQTLSANESAAVLCDACVELIGKVQELIQGNVPESSILAFAE